VSVVVARYQTAMVRSFGGFKTLGAPASSTACWLTRANAKLKGSSNPTGGTLVDAEGTPATPA
jgi:hypothetical protein